MSRAYERYDTELSAAALRREWRDRVRCHLC